jgi:hypothetical protein
MKEHLNEPRLTQFANPSNRDTERVNGPAVKDSLPFLKFVPTTIAERLFNQERHLIYPTTASEKNSVTGMPASYLTTSSLHYAFGSIPFQPADILDKLEGLTPNLNPTSNDDGTKLKELIDSQASLGNAMNLIEKSHERFQNNKNLIDFNLDGDRGYAYLCWTQQKDTGVNPSDFPENLVVSPSVQLKFIK